MSKKTRKRYSTSLAIKKTQIKMRSYVCHSGRQRLKKVDKTLCCQVSQKRSMLSLKLFSRWHRKQITHSCTGVWAQPLPCGLQRGKSESTNGPTREEWPNKWWHIYTRTYSLRTWSKPTATDTQSCPPCILELRKARHGTACTHNVIPAL